MTVLTADDIGDVHTYLAEARPGWEMPMARIKALGGPWPCGLCGGPSYLCYRCSRCGNDLAGTASA